MLRSQPYLQLPEHNYTGPVAVDPPGPGSNSPPPITLTGVPSWLAFLIAIGVVGGAAAIISNYSPKAGIMFTALVLMGYAASGNRYASIRDFLTNVTSVATGDNTNG